MSGPISILYLMVVVSRRSTRMQAISSSSAFMTITSAKRKLIISRPPILTLPSWSSNVSHLILSRKMLKGVGEKRPPTVVLNHSPVLPLNRNALLELSYRFSMALMMLALMLLIFAHKASCHTHCAGNITLTTSYEVYDNNSLIYVGYRLLYIPVKKENNNNNKKKKESFESKFSLRGNTSNDFTTDPSHSVCY